MTQRKGITIALWFLLIIICGSIARQSTFSADLSAFLPSEPSTSQQLLVDQLQNGLASRLILIGIEGSDTQALVQLSKAMAGTLRADNAFLSVNNGEPVNADREREFIFSHRYQLSPAITAERFTTAGLHASIKDSINLLASPAGLLIKPLFLRDPTGETLQILDRLNNKTRPHSVDNVWVSAHGNRAILMAQTRATGSDTDAQQHAINVIKQAFSQASQQHGETTAQLRLSGPGVFSVNARDTIKQEVMRLSIVTSLIIVTLLFLIYRSFTALALGTLPVITGILVGIAAVSLNFGMVHGVTLGFGITLIGEAIDYSIYLFIQSERGKAQARDQDWLAAFWPTIRLGVLTSIIGFSALLFSGFPGLAQLGFYSTSGLIAAAIVTRCVLPVLIPQHFHIRDVAHFGHVLTLVSQRAVPLRWLTAVLVCIACVLTYNHRHDIWSSDLAALSPVSAADRALDASLREDLGAADPRYFVSVSGINMDAAISAAEQISTQLDNLVNDGSIAGYDSPSHYLPGIATQQARLAAIPEPAELRRRLHDAVANLPLSAARLNGFLEDAETARNASPLDASDMKGTSMALAVDALLIDHGDHWSALLPLHTIKDTRIDPQRIRSTLAATTQPTAQFIDVKTELETMYSGYLDEAIQLSLGGLTAIIILLLIALHSPLRVARIILPLALAVIVVTAGLLGCGYHLSILHLIGLLLTVAIGSNYALFFDRRSHNTVESGYIRTLASLLFANLTTVTVFMLLAFSSVPVLQNIGMTVAPGVVLALLFSAIFAERQPPGMDTA